jgi:hypothetical protein
MLIDKHKLNFVNYFESLVNKIDLKTEIILHENPNISNDIRMYIYDRRDNLLEIIKQVEENILEKLDFNSEIDGPLRVDHFCLLVEPNNLNKHFKQHQANNSIIDSIYGYSIYGYLVLVIDGYLNQKELKLYKKLLEFYMNENSSFLIPDNSDNFMYELDFNNDFFSLKYKVMILRVRFTFSLQLTW